nr:nitrilase family protein [Roseateles sp. YR242]
MVACVQMEPRLGQRAQNLEESMVTIEMAAARGASVIVLPELVSSGYAFKSRSEAFAAAEPVSDSVSLRAWSEAASRLGVHLVAGFAEREGERLYNSAAIMSPRGLLGLYRKLHLWGDEQLFFEPGNLGLPVFDTDFGRIAAVICYDGWFPEVYRRLSEQHVDLVCMPTNWVPMPQQPAGMPAMANTLAMAAAHSNAMAIACANRVGVERGQAFIGQSLIVNADGWPLAGPASIDRPELLLARINIAQARRGRQLNAFNHLLRDRRADLFGACSFNEAAPRGLPAAAPSFER